jgi:hypothetical protein
VAAYFAVEANDTEDGQIWSFDRRRFAEDAEEKQWKIWPETTIDGSGDGPMFRAEMTAFKIEEPRSNWFTCYFYYPGFPRQDAQHGAYTMTAWFGRDHAEAIEEFFKDNSCHHLYVVSADLKRALRDYLRQNHHIWRGSLFPDAAGAAETAARVFEPERGASNMVRLSMTEACADLPGVFGRASQQGERVVVESNGKDLGAIVSMDDLALLR